METELMKIKTIFSVCSNSNSAKSPTSPRNVLPYQVSDFLQRKCVSPLSFGYASLSQREAKLTPLKIWTKSFGNAMVKGVDVGI